MTERTCSTVEGKIIKRKKRKCGFVLTIECCNSRLLANPNTDSLFDCCCFVGAVIRATVKRATDNDILLIQDLTLLKCAPDPKAVDVVLQALQQQQQQQQQHDNDHLTRDILVTSLGDTMVLEEALRIHHLEHRKRRMEIAKIVRQLDGAEAEREPRQRQPKRNKADLDLLDQLVLEGSSCNTLKRWKLYDLDDHASDTDIIRSSPHCAQETQPLNLPSQDLTLVSSRGHRTRYDYIHGKKQPQVQWMVSRMKKLCNQPPLHIVDVGGGRGDLATGCATAFPDAIITVVDKNVVSLNAGRDYSSQVLGLSSRSIHFVEADFLVFMNNTEHYVPEHAPKVDLVVGLHACGDLSDLALEFARKVDASFLICPCCYNKRLVPNYDPPWHPMLGEKLSPTQRLAESQIRSDSFRAMKIINSLRLQSYTNEQQSRTPNEPRFCMETYPSEYSLRNIVLIGRSNS